MSFFYRFRKTKPYPHGTLTATTKKGQRSFNPREEDSGAATMGKTNMDAMARVLKFSYVLGGMCLARDVIHLYPPFFFNSFFSPKRTRRNFSKENNFSTKGMEIKLQTK